MFARWKVKIRLIAIAAIFAALAGSALLEGHVAHAQGEERRYVDVGISLEAHDNISAILSQDFKIIVVNQGSGTAYDVEVVVDVVSPDKSRFGRS